MRYCRKQSVSSGRTLHYIKPFSALLAKRECLLLEHNNEPTQKGDKINWNTWNNQLKGDCVDFTPDELEFLEKFKPHCAKHNYEVTIRDSHIVILPIKYDDIMESKSEIWKHEGFFVIQRSRMWRRYGNSYEEGSREAFRCDEEKIYDIIGKYDLF